jgi:hypothetical protein
VLHLLCLPVHASISRVACCIAVFADKHIQGYRVSGLLHTGVGLSYRLSMT